MIHKIKSLILLFMLPLIFTCDVSFDETLEDYIEDVTARNPLDFSNSEVTEIDGENALNKGYVDSSYNGTTFTCTITNDYDYDVVMEEYAGASDNFIIDPYDSFTLTSGDSFTLNIQYSSTFAADIFNETISQKVELFETGGRAYTFYIWASNRSQPISFYDEDDNEISLYDLGNWYEDPEYTFRVVNEGLEEIDIDISVPANINLNSDSYKTLGIQEEHNVILQYFHDGTAVSGDNLSISVNNYSVATSSLNVSLYAGGALGIDFEDSSDISFSDVKWMGAYSETAVNETYTMINSSLFDIDLDVSVTVSNDSFTYTMPSTVELAAGEEYDFDVSFLPVSTDYQSMTFEFYDKNSGRYAYITFEGC